MIDLWCVAWRPWNCVIRLLKILKALRFHSIAVNLIKVPYGEGWSGVLISGMLTDNIVTLDTTKACGEGVKFSGLAYLWLETPCSGELACPLYAADEYRLPVAPFKMEISQ